MAHQPDVDVRAAIQRELGSHRATAPGILKTWSMPPETSTVQLKEVIAVIRPERYHDTKRRAQRVRVQAFTQQRVLGRGRERGLRYLPRRGAMRGAGVPYLPKRLVSWIVEAHQVAPLIQALIDVNQTGQLGDGKIFVLPVAQAVRVRTGERGVDAVRTQSPAEILLGTPIGGAAPAEAAHASR